MRLFFIKITPKTHVILNWNISGSEWLTKLTISYNEIGKSMVQKTKLYISSASESFLGWNDMVKRKLFEN